MATITLLGTGTPTNPHRFQSATLVEVGPDLLLFDCGRGTVHQLYQAGVDLRRISALFITHHHFDHINDLFDVLVSTAMRGRDHTLPIFGPPGTRAIVDALLNTVYAKDIRFRIEEDRELAARGIRQTENPARIADVLIEEIGSGVVASGAGWRVLTEYVVHGDFPLAPDFDWRCLGYRLETEGKVFTFSGDTIPCPGISWLARGADLLQQNCHMMMSALDDPTMRYISETILAATSQAGQIAAEAGVQRMVLTHLSANMNDASFAQIEREVRRYFAGELILGHDLQSLML